MSTQKIHIAEHFHDGLAAERSSTSAWRALDAVALPLRRTLTRFILERALSRAENELMALDVRVLSDIGLIRSDIALVDRNSDPRSPTCFSRGGSET
jgi:uncharacterized protein YjiS (DUF1127 family)